MGKEFTFSHFVNWLFYGLLSFFAWGIREDMANITSSINDLNENMATVFANDKGHDRQLRTVEKRIDALDALHRK